MNNINTHFKQIEDAIDKDINDLLFNINNTKNIDTLVMSGGGIKGLAHIGCLKAFEDLDIIRQIDTFVGTSIGSFILGIYLCGYTAIEMFDFVLQCDLDSLKSVDLFNAITHLGLDTGENISKFIINLIINKGLDENITLKQLYNKTNKKLIITTTILNSQQPCYMSFENYPNIPLHLAIRMSISIPIYFSPVKYEGQFYIDGSCMDDYPIHLFKNKINSVIGICLTKTKNFTQDIEYFEDYVVLIMNCFMQGMSFNSIKGFQDHTIQIDFDFINIVNFSLDKYQKLKMFDAGYHSVFNYFDKS
jgi:NTE family protein